MGSWGSAVSPGWVVSLDRIIELNNNRPPLTFKRFQAIVSRLELPRKPLPSITPEQMDSCRVRIADNHDEHYSVPSLEELGEHGPQQPPSTFSQPGSGVVVKQHTSPNPNQPQHI